MSRCAYRARLLYFTDDPREGDGAVYHADGLLLVEGGRVLFCGAYQACAPALLRDVPIQHQAASLIVPGLIDTHVHYPQIDMVASPAEGLLPWLSHYTFPTERRFADPQHARATARFFVDQLLACGTTTAMVYCTVEPDSVDALLEESERRNMRLIAGKVMMDRDCPDFLRDSAESSYRDSMALIERWHGRGRQLYALTPRFALTSSEAQLQACAALAQAYPDVFIQTHLAENVEEVRRVAERFPTQRSYLDVYARFGLVRPRAVFGHCLHLDDADRRCMACHGAVAAHCPTSNLFLGSGLFDFAAAQRCGLQVSLGTDIGAGTSLSLLQTMNEAYKVARLGGTHLPATRLFYLATLGAARALGLEGQIGSLRPGSEADFVLLDPLATPLLAHRTRQAESLEELLFALALLGDDRAVAASYVAGRCLHRRDVARPDASAGGHAAVSASS